MISQKLHDNWKMREAGDGNYINVTVPGSMYSAFLENGMMEDPFYRDNENETLKLSEKDYEFVTEFAVSEEILDCPYAVLTFYGLDTIADIWLNEEHIGYVDNMHREWEYEVKRLLKPQGNTLRILFHSPIQYIWEQKKKAFWPMSTDAMAGAAQIRKSHCMFGWDWGPRLPDMGIYRDVVLRGTQAERLDSVYIWQEHEDGRVILKLDIDVECMDEEQGFAFDKDEAKLTDRGVSALVRIKNQEERFFVKKYSGREYKRRL